MDHPAPRIEAQDAGGDRTVGPIDASRVPRFAGPATFARLPRADEVPAWTVSVAGVPFDSGVSYRPGARFGPAAVREASRLLRPYHPGLDVEPFAVVQVVDAGDIVATPFDIEEAIGQIDAGATALVRGGRRLVSVGGDHTISLPLLRAHARSEGPLALVHFDAHLDTWDTYFGAPYTHGTPFRRAFEEGLLAEDHCLHVGTRGPLYAATDLTDDAGMGFRVVTSAELDDLGPAGAAARIRDRVGGAPLYLSIDIDVLDPAHAPGTGTPEAGGLSSRELLGILRRLVGLRLVGADVVEVAPAYDHAEITAIAASHVVYELVGLLARQADEQARSTMGELAGSEGRVPYVVQDVDNGR
jgi:agmatinase